MGNTTNADTPPAALQARAAGLEQLSIGLFNQDFLLTWQRTADELRAVLLAAEVLQGLYRQGASARLFDSGLAVSIFRDQSTRTRFSFSSAANLLGLATQDLDEAKSQIAHGETVRETANMISFLTEVVGIRDDMFLGAGHQYMVEVSEALQEGYHDGVLDQRPAVINLQCDLDHPTQALADLMHLQQVFGSLDALRGKKLAMSWAYSPSYGKPLSVPQGIITLMTRFGMNVTLAHPAGYELVPETLEIARRHARESGGSFSQVHDLEEAFADADIVYPKSWAPYTVMEQRTELLRSMRTAELQQLEDRCLKQNAQHRVWECNERAMGMTRGGRALYMHCLPADISGVSCQSGEVTADVFERQRLATYREASFKPFVIAAMMLLTRFEQPATVLRTLLERRAPRRH